MAFENKAVYITAVAGASFASTDQYKAVKFSDAKTVVLCDAAGESADGILQDESADSGDAVTICVLGVTKMRAAGSLTAPQMLKTSAAGKLVAASASVVDTQAGSATDAVIGSYVVGKSITDAGADNEIFTGIFNPMGAVPTTAA